MLHVIITGATGMVGKGVLLSCLKDPSIEKITLISRRSLGLIDSKIEEVLLQDFANLEELKEQLNRADACFHCMGVSSLGLSKEDYYSKTFIYTKSLADLCFQVNPKMTFCYVSGTGTSTTETSRQAWANVKGKAENYLIQKGFQRVFLFRPGLILPEDGIQSATGWYNTIYKIMRPFFGLMKRSKHVTSTRKIGAAMISAALYKKPIVVHLENPQINAWAQKVRAT